MNWLQKTSQQLLSRSEFENMVQRVFNRNREYLREEGIHTWKQWLNTYDDYNLSLVLESDHDIYDRFLRDLPENTMAIDLIKLYRQNQLPETQKEPYTFQRRPIEPTQIEPSLPWQSKNIQELTPEEAKNIYEIAKQRKTKSNSPQVNEARKTIFFAYYLNPQISKILDVTPTKLRSFAGLKKHQIDAEKSLNRDVPTEHQWVGMTNSSFIGRQQVDIADLDQFVASINVQKEGRSYWLNQGDILRRYILDAFMSIDSRLSYEDLAFEIGKCETEVGGRTKRHRGQYFSREKKIVIADLNPHTVAHEIGHYLDHKWTLEYLKQYGQYLSEINIDKYPLLIKKEVSEEHKEWIKKYQNFIQNNLMNKSEIYSEYTQSAKEVFARFIDRFVRWTQNYQYYTPPSYFDKFTESDYKVFVQLLQEKSFLDAKFPTKKDFST